MEKAKAALRGKRHSYGDGAGRSSGGGASEAKDGEVVRERMPGVADHQDGAAATGAEDIFCVHRLDRETSGLMVYARTKDAAAALSAAVAAREFRKEYRAVDEMS